ncbi:hypothetical protein L6164_034135 [Bauhinia variegata]|uniref:Uncharacterized protein n=1 Tax=Bauhinia variegata TaxID=167791 RepID=A0ACB9KTZ8_BAUVA|nr:hypothetical protein L6164_034135 [Bauhinia variegata]
MKEKKVCVVWEDLTVKVPTSLGAAATADDPKSRKLLDGITGFAEPGRIMALMGPSGSGKTTLLDSLAGRIPANVTITGDILINGSKRNLYCTEVSYVAQEELFLGTLTVRETLTYSANMRLPSKMSKEEIRKVVEETIMEMGLEDCADNKIGNWHLRGISNGEKKRLSVGLEILTQPSILLLDEPTSGLDSASAFYVIQALTKIAHDGKIVVCSVHQPSGETFDLFDDLLLLSSGETVYFGAAKKALKFFTDAGFPCPTTRNPSDHFLLCINLDFDSITTTLIRSQICLSSQSNTAWDKTTAQIRATLIENYKSSELMIMARERIEKLKLNEAQVTESSISRRTNWWRQLFTLSKRSFLNMTRDIGYYWLRIIFYILVSITVGLPFFIEELKVFYGEKSKGHYGEAVFVISNFVSSFPFLVVISFFSGTIIYFMVQFHPGLSNYVFFCINLLCCLSVIEACALVVASVVPNVLMGIGTATGVIIFMMMSSQIFRPLPDLPKFFWRYPMSYLSFATWAVQGQYKNDMLGLEFDPLVPGYPKVKGEQVLELVFGVPLNHAKWWDLTALVTLLLVHRLLFYLVLMYKSRSKSTMLGFCAKLSMHNFAQRLLPSKKTSISSKKHRPPNSLSSQEGFMSPNLAM